MSKPELALGGAMEESSAVRLARTLAERVSFDRSGASERAYVDALIEQLQKDRLVWAPAAPEAGGLGSTLGELATITHHLARASGSLGLIYAMHMSQAMTLLRHAGDSPALLALVDLLVSQQALVASGTSEKGVGGDIFGSLCTIEKAEDQGLTLTKESPNISYLDKAQVVLVTAMRQGPRNRDTQVLVAAELSRMVLEPGPETQMMGMRGILNRPYRLTAGFEDEMVFREPYPAIARATMTPVIHILWAALWSGLAASALAKVRQFLAKQREDDQVAGLLRAEWSRLVDAQYELNAIIRDAVADYETSGSRRAMTMAGTARVKRLKVVGSRLVQEICLGALGVIGMAAYCESGPYSLAGVIRDALSARVMISNYRLLLANSGVERFIEEEL